MLKNACILLLCGIPALSPVGHAEGTATAAPTWCSGMLELASSIKDKETADAAAPLFARGTFQSLLRLINEGGCGITEELQRAEAMLRNANPPYFGSEKLELAAWGARHLTCRMKRELQWAVKEQLEGTVQAAEELPALLHALEGVTDKASADRAAERLSGFTCSLSYASCYSDQPALEAWLKLCSPVTRRDAVNALRPLAQKLQQQNPSCFGSADLQRRLAIILKEPEQPVTSGEFAAYTQDWEKLAQLAAQMLETAKSVHDRKSADAAAPVLQSLQEEYTRHHGHLKQQGLPTSVANTINNSAVFESIFASGMELEQVHRRLEKADPPFYGSKALEAAIQGE